MNNLDPEVAEDPDHLVVYGGTGRAARTWAAFDAIVRELRRARRRRDAAGPVGQAGRASCGPTRGRRACSSPTRTSSASGRPGSTSASSSAPGLMMYGQMTAGSWIYIGTQGILQGTYETFAEAARQHFGGTLRGTRHPDRRARRDGRRPAAGRDDERRRLPRDRGRRGARPAPARHRLRRSADGDPGGGARLGARGGRARRGRVASRWSATPPRSSRPGRPPASGSTSSPTRPRPTTRSAGYVPAEIALADALELRARPARTSTSAGLAARWPPTSGRCSRSSAPARSSSTTATTCAPRRRRPASTDAFDYPGFVPAFIRPQFCEGRGPFRWAALSGDPADILRTDRAVLELFPDDAGLRRWIEMAEARVPFQGLPARICWLGYGERARAGLAFNELVRTRRGRAPRSSSAATTSTRARSPRRTARPRRWLDGSDAVADWPLLNALVNTAAGATWVSIHHGGGVGIGYSQHAGMVVVADGTRARRREARARPDHRSGDGRPPPRRRGLRAGDRGRARARHPRADARRARSEARARRGAPAARDRRWRRRAG